MNENFREELAGIFESVLIENDIPNTKVISKAQLNVFYEHFRGMHVYIGDKSIKTYRTKKVE